MGRKRSYTSNPDKGVGAYRQFWPPAPPLASICSLPSQNKTLGYVVPNVTILNPPNTPQSGKYVFVRHGRIQQLFEESEISDFKKLNPNVTFLDQYPYSEGRCNCPHQINRLGFIDMHTHLPPDNFLRLSPYFSLLYLYHGVTTVRDAGDVDGTSVNAVEYGSRRNLFPTPRVFPCGPFVAGGTPRWANTIVLNDSSVETAENLVKHLLSKGSKCIKAYDDLDQPRIRALVTAAEKHKIQVIGHIPTLVSYEDALIPEVQHMHGVPLPAHVEQDHILNRLSDWDHVDEERMNFIVDISKEKSIANTPTLNAHRLLLHYDNVDSVFKNESSPVRQLLPNFYADVVWDPVEGLPIYRNIPKERIKRLADSLEKKIRLTRKLIDAGLSVFAGTDVQQPFVIPGLSLHQEASIFRQLVGLSAQETLELITSKAGDHITRFLPDEDPRKGLGRIQIDAPADLLLFKTAPGFNTPLDELATRFNSTDALPYVVIKDGCLFLRSMLENRIAAWRAQFDTWLWENVSQVAARFVLRRVVKRSH